MASAPFLRRMLVHHVGAHLQDMVILFRKGMVPRRIGAQGPSRGQGAADEGAHSGLAAFAVVVKVAVLAVELGHEKRLAAAQDPSHQSLTGRNAHVGDDVVAGAAVGGEAGRLGLLRAPGVGNKKNNRIGIENAGDKSEHLLLEGRGI